MLGVFTKLEDAQPLAELGIVFLMCIAVGIGVSAIQGADDHPHAIDYDEVDTTTTTGFNVAAIAIVLMLTALYATWW